MICYLSTMHHSYIFSYSILSSLNPRPVQALVCSTFPKIHQHSRIISKVASIVGYADGMLCSSSICLSSFGVDCFPRVIRCVVLVATYRQSAKSTRFQFRNPNPEAFRYPPPFIHSAVVTTARMVGGKRKSTLVSKIVQTERRTGTIRRDAVTAAVGSLFRFAGCCTVVAPGTGGSSLVVGRPCRGG